MKRGAGLGLTALVLASASCATAGSAWMAEPLEGDLGDTELAAAERSPVDAPPRSRPSRVIGREEAVAPTDASGSDAPAVAVRLGPSDGRVLGVFRNTYYDFPLESDYSGKEIALLDASCRPLAQVPAGFFESVCVQGSGKLATGETVSFAKRDCACAPVCPRTGQHICFDRLDAARFPWGRGATGAGITPLLTVAVDSSVVPLGTALYLPEYDGVPRDASGAARHDGCFIAQDRGLAVQGEHIDVFTGNRAVTALWNRLVPTGRGVTVVVDSPRCRR